MALRYIERDYHPDEQKWRWKIETGFIVYPGIVIAVDGDSRDICGCTSDIYVEAGSTSEKKEATEDHSLGKIAKDVM